jgi:hypothetical protein
MAWLPIAVPQDASPADFMCKRWRRVLAWLFFCGRFERLSLEKSTSYDGMRNHNFCC